MLHVHSRLGLLRAVSLPNTFSHALGHLGRRVADIDLATSDIPGPAIQRDALGKTRYGVLGCCVRR